MSRLILRLLGTPEVSHAGKLLTFPTRKVLALLAYLAAEQGMHYRDKMTALLWPESDEERGKGSLRRTLAYLRETLEESTHERSGSPLAPHLLVEHDALGFNPGSDFDLDLHTLQGAFTLARRRAPADNAADLRAQLARLQAAVALYRGNFLDGLALPGASDFEDWLLLQRETWHNRVTKVFDRLSQLQTDGGELEQALETTMRWAAHDSLNEAAHARLIELHYALGDRTAALRAYEAYRAYLERELNAEPAPGTMALVESIRTQVSPVLVLAPDEPLSPQTLLELPLTGRMLEHSALLTAFRMTRRGRTQVVIVEGEPGIGKTRLTKEFLKWARAQAADVLEGRAFETGGRLPYQPLIEALRSRLEREQHPEKLVSEMWLAELARVLPELRDRFPSLPAPLTLDESESRTRLFEAVSRLGQALAERVPVVLFVDDVHWADAASLDVLHYACRRWATARIPLLLLVTLRSEELASSSVLMDWVTGLERALPVTRQVLSPLTFEDTLRLVQSIAGTGRSGERSARTNELQVDRATYLKAFSQGLFAETGGQPFFLIETLKSFAEDGILQADEAGAWSIDVDQAEQSAAARREVLPGSVQALIHARLAHLSAGGLAACMAGAVLGQGFDFEQLCWVAAVSESEGLAALDELLKRGLLRESGGKCYFVHDLIREVTYLEASEARRRVLHRRVLETLEATHAPAAKMAEHARAAGMLERAFILSREAGHAAMRLFAVRDAIEHYERARDLAPPFTPERSDATNLARDLQQIYSELGRAYELNSQRSFALACYETMLTLARTSSLPEMEVAALNALATLSSQDLRNPEQAQELLRQALAAAERSGDSIGLVQAEWNLAQSALYWLDRENALAHGERALSLARELDMKEFIARGLNQLALIELQSSRATTAETYATEAVAMYALLSNRVMQVDSMIYLADARFIAGKLEEGIVTAREAHRISLEIENTWSGANSARQLAMGLSDRGEYMQALAVAQRGVALARTSGYVPVLVFTLWWLGNIYRQIFALDAARAAHQEVNAIVEVLNHPLFTRMALAGLSADAAVAGDWQEAYHYVQQTFAINSYNMPYVGYTFWYETEALLRAGEIERAVENVRLFGEGAGSNRRYRVPYLRALAALHAWRAESELAITRLQEVLALANEIGLPGEVWSIEAELGRLYRLGGDESQASRAFARAIEIVVSLANGIVDEQLRATFLASGPVQEVLQFAPL